MPRGERPLGDGNTVLLKFAGDLRRLRQRAGSPTYRVLAERVHYSVATLSEAAAGRRLPSLGVTLAYVRACDGEVGEWERRWHEVAAELAVTGAAEPRPEDEPPAPYVGLNAFQTADADRFFGREQLVEELVERLGQQRLLPVFGASGAGKSSLLRAGLVPRWPGPVVLYTPGPRPLEESAIQLSRLTGGPPGVLHSELNGDPRGLHRTASTAVNGGPELLIVVDQFEEVFTLCRDPAERARFVHLLTTAATAENSRCRVVLGIRDDFYVHCGKFSGLVEAPLTVGPMTAEEQRRAITEPAVRAGYTLEGALLATLVADAHGQPGVLPLLSHALLETWRRRRGNTLTLSGFQAAGGIHGALAHTAETVYQALEPVQQRLARNLFLRLTALGEGTEDTRRRLPSHELAPDAAEVVDRLARARLLTIDRDRVEITHEALIRCWPRLHDWLAEDREGLRVHRRLTEAAEQWRALGCDPGALYRGTQLALAEEWVGAGERDLTPWEERFLHNSRAAQVTEAAAERRRGRRLRQLVALLTVLFVLASAATALAVRAQRTATRERDVATSQRVADRAAAMRGTSPALAAQLSLAAYRLAPTVEARSSLLSTFAIPYATQLMGGDVMDAVAFSPDGRTLATGGHDRVLRLWDTEDPHHPWSLAMLTGHTSTIRAVAFGADGSTVAATGEDGTVREWDVRKPSAAGDRIARAVPAVFSPDRRTTAGADDDGTVWLRTGAGPSQRSGTKHAGRVNAVVFSPDGRTLASAGEDHTVKLWSVADLREVATLTGHSDAVRSVAFSPDGRTLVSAGADASVRLWTVAGPRELAVLSGHTAAVNAVAVSPDGRTLASASADHTVRLWDFPGPWLVGHESSVYAVAVSPDGRTVATAGYDQTVRLWSVADRRELAVQRGHTGPVNGLAFSPDGRVLASASHDGTVRLWDGGGPLIHPASVEALAYSPDGRLLATAAADRTVRLWDMTGRRQVGTLAGHADSVDAVAFSPDGRVLATAAADRTVRLWNVADQRQLGTLAGHVDTVKSVAFSPDGKTLASGGEDRTVRLWNVADPRHPGPLATLNGYTDGVKAVRFSPDGRTVATASSDRTVRLWDAADRRHPAELAVLTGHAKPVDALAFAPDGHTLASGGEDWIGLLWETDPSRVAERICAIAHPRMSQWDWDEYFPGVPYQPPC